MVTLHSKTCSLTAIVFLFSAELYQLRALEQANAAKGKASSVLRGEPTSPAQNTYCVGKGSMVDSS